MTAKNLTSQVGSKQFYNPECRYTFTMNSLVKTSILSGFNIKFKFDVFVVQIIFWILATKNLSTPGYYMDEAGIDWLAAHLLNPDLQNPMWITPQVGLPLLGTLYAGYLGTYLEIPPLYVLGFSVETIRIVHLLILSISIMLIQLILRKFEYPRLLSFLMTMSVAVSSPLIFGMRSHFYNCAVGIPFLLGAIYMFTNRRIDRRNILLAGILFGVSFFSYFNYLFFFPMFLLLLKSKNFKYKSIETLTFFGGFGIGSIGYIIGYISLFLKLGSISSGIAWIKWANGFIAPNNDEGSLVSKLIFGFDLAVKGLSNQGNFLQFFGLRSESSLIQVPVILMSAVILIGITTTVINDFRKRIVSLEIAFMSAPIIFLLMISSLFGSRIGYQHLMPFFVTFYLSFAISLGVLLKSFKFARERLRKVYLVTSVLLLIPTSAGYLVQYASIQKALIETGGLGMSSSALNLMINEANTDRNEGKIAKYYFPEWGFWMPFATVTANQIPYGIDSINWENLASESANGTDVKVFSWSKDKANEILDTALDSVSLIGSIKEWKSRNGTTSFYEIYFPKK
jgi:hypothetical protein